MSYLADVEQLRDEILERWDFVIPQVGSNLEAPYVRSALAEHASQVSIASIDRRSVENTHRHFIWGNTWQYVTLGIVTEAIVLLAFWLIQR